MLFDAHTHINNEEYTTEGRAELIEAIEASDVARAVDIGFDVPSSQMAAEHAEKYEWCYAAAGVHPHDTEHMTEDDLKKIKEIAAKEKVVAIGEIGLDYYRSYSPKECQQEWFRRQIRLANELGMPIMIHEREAHMDVMEILKEEGAFSDERKSKFPPRKRPDGGTEPDARVMIHCFSGSRELAEQYVKLGAWISICGPVTYKNNKKTVSVVEAIPLEYLTIETDAPYLTPVPFRGKENKSPYVEYTARKIAEIKGITYEEVAEKTFENAEVFFGIK